MRSAPACAVLRLTGGAYGNEVGVDGCAILAGEPAGARGILAGEPAMARKACGVGIVRRTMILHGSVAY